MRVCVGVEINEQFGGRKGGYGGGCAGAKQPPLTVNVPWGGGLKSSMLGGGVFECTFHGVCRVLKEG